MRGSNRSTFIKITRSSRVITRHLFHNSRFRKFVKSCMKQHVIPTRCLDPIGDRVDDKKVRCVVSLNPLAAGGM
jgi:hypothetical protein